MSPLPPLLAGADRDIVGDDIHLGNTDLADQLLKAICSNRSDLIDMIWYYIGIYFEVSFLFTSLLWWKGRSLKMLTCKQFTTDSFPNYWFFFERSFDAYWWEIYVFASKFQVLYAHTFGCWCKFKWGLRTIEKTCTPCLKVVLTKTHYIYSVQFSFSNFFNSKKLWFCGISVLFW